MVDQSVRDLLSELPLDIIHSILALVPIRDAVKTSILSRQWRYKWASLPRLVFDEVCVSSTREHATRTKQFVTQAPTHKSEVHESYEVDSCQYTDQYLSIGVESCHRSIVFHHLRVIDLSAMYIDVAKKILVVVRLNSGAPHPHKVTIAYVDASEVAGISLGESEIAHIFRFERLKVIEMTNFRGELIELKLTEVLSVSSSALERMIFNPIRGLTVRQTRSLLVKLGRYRRGSSKARILYQEQDS